jgi:ABC-type lipoprotein release transport system permease subunit
MARLWLLLRLALRNLRRQMRRSLLTAAAMVLGLALLILSRTLADGGHEDWIDAGVRLGSGHVALQTPAFQTSHAIEDRLSSSARRAAEQALAHPDVAPRVDVVAPRVAVQALASSPSGAVPIIVLGVDPDIEAGYTSLDEKLVAGRYLQRGDRLHAYVGKGLAERLELDVGSRLVLSAQDADGEIAGQLVRVAGIFRMGLPEADEGIVHIPLATAQDWLGLDGEVTTLAVVLRSSRDVPAVARTLREELAPLAGEVTVLGWQQAMPGLDAAVKVDDYGDYIFHIILFVIIALAIVNTVLMSVLYRVREFGVIRALGLTKRESGLLVFCEGVLLTVVSGVVGLVLGLAVTWFFFRDGLDFSFLLDTELTAAGVVIDPVIIPEFRVAQLVQSVGFIFAIGILASLYPAYRATRIDIAESMKFEA